ncbi:MAG TPA: hypothetical protein VMW31_05110 [Devosiaceae bacterium]|nr:hypothetical protein [Devosiaceae bacterium]
MNAKPASPAAADLQTLLGADDLVLLCNRAEAALRALVEAMNSETVLLRTGRLSQASALTVEKTRLAQDYVHAARAI